MKDTSLFEHEARLSTGPTILLALTLCGFAVPVVFVVLLNWLGDSSRIFFRYDASNIVANRDYIRVDYLINHPHHYDLLLLGSSRANSIDPQQDLGDDTYLLSSSGGIVRIFYLQLKAVLEHDVSADTVVVGLGEAAYKSPYTPQLASRQHPVIQGKSRIRFYCEQLFRIPTMDTFKLAGERLEDLFTGTAVPSRKTQELITRGRYYCELCEFVANRMSPEERLNYVSRFYVWPVRYSVDGALSDIEAIITLARQHGIRLLFYIDPIFSGKYTQMDLEPHHRFKRGLGELTPFLDFNTFNPVYQDAATFIDTSHVSERIGHRMAKDLRFALAGQPERAELSVWVNSDNVEAHLAGQAAQQAQRRTTGQ